MAKNIDEQENKSCDVTVVGGGIAGVCTAITLAESGYHVVLLEKKSDILEKTSNITPGRMSLGIHYLGDFNTAKFNLLKTLEFIKFFKNYFPDCFIKGASNDNWHYGLYALLKDSLISGERVLESLELLKEIYRQTIVKPDFHFLTDFYGSPEKFYEIINIDSYKCFNQEHISLLIKTKEILLDWIKFKTLLKSRLISNPCIRIICNAEVTKISEGYHNFNHEISYLDGEKGTKKYLTDFAIVCAWESIEEINLNSKIMPSQTTNRVKLIAHIRLPNSLTYHPSTFFLLGAFAMFSNMGDGTAKITYAPKSNLISSNDCPLPHLFKKIISDDDIIINIEKYRNIGLDIIRGLSKYIPEAEKSKLIDVKLGIVKQIHQNQGEFFNLKDGLSNHHKRAYSGVEVKNKAKTIINNSAIKLMYAASNATEILRIINSKHIKIKSY